jgi:hypothetical protein
MGKKVGIISYGGLDAPACNTKAYQLELAVKLRKFAALLEDPNTGVIKRKSLSGDDPNMSFFWFATLGNNERHFAVWGGVTVPGRDDDFGDGDGETS